MLDTQEYHLAPSGEGPHAATWEDKPHRLVYDLCGEIDHLHQRLMMDGGKPHYSDCCEYSDALVDHGEPRFGNLSRLEWMLRTVVGRCYRQDAYIEKLEAKLKLNIEREAYDA